MPHRRWSPKLTLVLLAGGGLVLWLAAREISLRQALEALTLLGGRRILLLGLCDLLILFTMTARWRILASALGYEVPYRSLIKIRLVGNAVSYFTPGPQFGGEPIQIYLLHHGPGQNGTPPMSLNAATASVAMDRLLELLANVIFLFLGLICVARQNFSEGFSTGRAFGVAGLLFLLPAGGLWALYAGRRPFSGTLVRLERLALALRQRWTPAWQHSRFLWNTAAWSALVQTLGQAEMQLEILCQRQHPVLVRALLASGINWGCVIAEFWVMYSFLGVTLGAREVIIALTAARFAFLTPLPGGLGALEASQVFILQALGLNASLGISACILIRLRDLVFGGWGLWLARRFLAAIEREQSS